MIAATIMFSLQLAAPDEGKNQLYCHYKLIDMKLSVGPRAT